MTARRSLTSAAAIFTTIAMTDHTMLTAFGTAADATHGSASRSRSNTQRLIHELTIMADAADEIPQTQCPKCGAWVDDYDGFGVLAHPECGYCCHPSSTNGVCGICGASTNDTDCEHGE